jgi:YD repeat-containing protein
MQVEKNKCGEGNPILSDGGVKVQTEHDGMFEGWPLDRFYSSRGVLNSLDSTFGITSHDHNWRGSFDYRLQISSSGTYVAASLMLPDGTIQYFGPTGNPLLATDKSTWKFATLAGGGYAVTTDDAMLVFNAVGTLSRIHRAAGRRLDLAYSDTTTVAVDASGATLDGLTGANLLMSVVSDTGRAMYFDRDVRGRITRMRLPDSVTPVTYAYSSGLNAANQPVPSMLTDVRYIDQSGRTYLYNEPAYMNGGSFPTALTGVQINGAPGVQGGRYSYFSYDTSGRAISTDHGNGIDRFSVNLVTPYGQSIVTNPLGSQRTKTYATVNGVSSLVATSQPAGSGCAARTSALSYDANGNVEAEDDFNGNRVCKAHDPTRNLENVRVEGLASTATCSAVNTGGAAVPAGARKISTQWHPDWRLETRRAEPKKITTFVYNGQPDPSNGNAIASCAPGAALLPDGKPIAVLCKTVEQATTDADGAQAFSAAATGLARVTSATYNLRGQVQSRTDARAFPTNYTYHATATADTMPGDLQSITNAAGHVTQYTRFDKAGRVLRMVEPNGVVTETTYNPRGWVTSVTVTPSTGTAQATTYTHNDMGQLATVTLPDGTTMSYAYDAARRLTGVTDGAGNSVTYTLDNAGNRTSEQHKDPGGALARNIARAFDALGRLQVVTGAPQ